MPAARGSCDRPPRTACDLTGRHAATAWSAATAHSAALSATRALLVLLSLAAALFSTPAAAQSGAPILAALPERPVELPVIPCDSLASHPFTTSAQVTFKVISASIHPAEAGRAELCVVKGYVAPQVQFVLYLPTTTYAGRYLQGGCGGMCGVIGESLQPTCENASAFAGSFAVAFNNSGHVGAGIGDGAWALGAAELREDYAHRATHVAQLAAKAILAAYYGKPPRWSYFQGCSDGGREGLMEALRYPEDFNGIVAGSVFSIAAIMEKFLWDAQVGLTSDGKSILTPEATDLLHRAVLRACDAVDGTHDAQIDDPRRCHYDPGKLACRGHQQPPACLTPRQVTAARLLYQGPRDSEGRQLFPGGLPYGSELLWSQPGAIATPGAAAEGFLHYVAFPSQLPADFTWRDWKFDRPSFERLDRAAEFADPRSPDLRPFRAHGGKLILWQGTADQASGIKGMPEYYQAIRDVTGGLEPARAFARLFLVPGVYHCGGGYMAYQEDFLGAMVNWIEKGQPPQQILATARLPHGGTRERPLFAYPEQARYIGGNVNDARSFVGAMPAKEPDDHSDWAGAYHRDTPHP